MPCTALHSLLKLKPCTQFAVMFEWTTANMQMEIIAAHRPKPPSQALRAQENTSTSCIFSSSGFCPNILFLFLFRNCNHTFAGVKYIECNLLHPTDDVIEPLSAVMFFCTAFEARHLPLPLRPGYHLGFFCVASFVAKACLAQPRKWPEKSPSKKNAPPKVQSQTPKLLPDRHGDFGLSILWLKHLTQILSKTLERPCWQTDMRPEHVLTRASALDYNAWGHASRTTTLEELPQNSCCSSFTPCSGCVNAVCGAQTKRSDPQTSRQSQD